jgi:hypothetical protein
MGSLTQGVALRQRMKSRILSGRIGGATPEQHLFFSFHVAAGAVPGTVVWVNPSDISGLKIVDVRERHTTPGATPIKLRVHAKGVVALPTAAVSGSTIYDLINVPITAAANTWTRMTSVGGVPGTITAVTPPAGLRSAVVPPGGTLVFVSTDATVVGVSLELLGVYD